MFLLKFLPYFCRPKEKSRDFSPLFWIPDHLRAITVPTVMPNNPAYKSRCLRATANPCSFFLISSFNICNNTFNSFNSCCASVIDIFAFINDCCVSSSCICNISNRCICSLESSLSIVNFCRSSAKSIFSPLNSVFNEFH